MSPLPSDAAMLDDAVTADPKPSGDFNNNNTASDTGDESSDGEPEEHAQLLLHLAVQQQNAFTDASKGSPRARSRAAAAAGRQEQLDPVVERRMQARRESARVRRAKRKSSMETIAQENHFLQEQVKQLQAALLTLQPQLPLSALCHPARSARAAAAAHKAAANTAAAGAAAAGVGVNAPAFKKRAPGEKMTIEQLKQARREAAHRSRQREKAMKEQLDEDNILLKEEVQWLHQQLQHCQQVAPQQQHRTAPVVAYAALGPISVALPGMLQQQHQQLAVQANDSDASLVLHQQQQQQIPRQLSGTGAVLLQKQNQAQRHSDAGAVFLQAATPYVGGASGHEQQYSEQQQQQQHALVSHNAAAVLLSGGTSGIMPEARDQEQLLRQLSGFASLLTAAPPGTPDINDDQQQPQKQLSDMLTALLCAASGDKEGAAEELTQQLQGPGVRPVGTAERERQQQGVQEQEEDAMMDAVEQQKMEMFDLLAQVLVETAAALHKAGAAPEDGSGLAGQQQLQQQLQWRLKAVSMLAATLLLEGQQMHS